MFKKHTHKKNKRFGFTSLLHCEKKTGCTQYFAIPETIPIIEASMSV